MKKSFTVPTVVLTLAFVLLAVSVAYSNDERFSRSDDGVITDSQTNLQWLPGPDQNTNYGEAERWVAAQTVAGGGWRMPTQEELQTLYDDSFEYHISPLFKATGIRWVWADSHDSPIGLGCYFYDGAGFRGDRRDAKNLRVFAVRTAPDAAGENASTRQAKIAAISQAATGPKSSPEVLAGRLSKSADGVITDAKTNLQWLPGPDRDTSYDEAERWVTAQTAAGGGWRMPTNKELKTLYGTGTYAHGLSISPVIFNTRNPYLSVWAGPHGASAAREFLFLTGDYRLCDRGGDFRGRRVFAVRATPGTIGEKTPKTVAAPQPTAEVTAAQFSKSADGVVTDAKTGLQWLPSPYQDMTFDEAKAWVAAQTVAGGGWRLPTREELESLFGKFGSSVSISPLIFTPPLRKDIDKSCSGCDILCSGGWFSQLWMRLVTPSLYKDCNGPVSFLFVWAEPCGPSSTQRFTFMNNATYTHCSSPSDNPLVRPGGPRVVIAVRSQK